MNKNKEKPFLTFKRRLTSIYFLGIVLTALFVITYLVVVFLTKKLNFYSFFFHNISSQLLLMILSIIHVAMLGFGILLMIVSFLNMPIALYCYKDRFVISVFLQEKKEVLYSEISDIDVRVCLNCYLNNQKECRVTFNNRVHSFYLTYPVKGYFDNVELCSKKEREDFLRRVNAKKEEIEVVLKQLKTICGRAMPFLPPEVNEKNN